MTAARSRMKPTGSREVTKTSRERTEGKYCKENCTEGKFCRLCNTERGEFFFSEEKEAYIMYTSSRLSAASCFHGERWKATDLTEVCVCTQEPVEWGCHTRNERNDDNTPWNLTEMEGEERRRKSQGAEAHRRGQSPRAHPEMRAASRRNLRYPCCCAQCSEGLCLLRSGETAIPPCRKVQ